MLELAAVESGLRSLILDSGYIPAGVAVEPGPFKEDMVSPIVLYDYISSRDIKLNGGRIIWTSVTYQIRAYAEGYTIGVVRPAAVAIHQSLQGKSIVTSDGTVYQIIRSRVLSQPARLIDGRQYQFMGGWYDFIVTVVYP